MLDDLLSRQGYRLNHALSGREGIESAARQRPDLVILDLMMEEMDGFEVAAALKDDSTTANIPILVLTARDLTTNDRTRLNGKVASLVHKGDAEGRLAGVIGEIVGRRTTLNA
jgi:CheY-like chemotaxis protein